MNTCLTPAPNYDCASVKQSAKFTLHLPGGTANANNRYRSSRARKLECAKYFCARNRDAIRAREIEPRSFLPL